MSYDGRTACTGGQMSYDGFTLDVVVHRWPTRDPFVQARFLVHGYDDVLWTDSIEAVVGYLKEDLERLTAVKLPAQEEKT